MAGYYRRFIEVFSKISNPLNQLLKKDSPFIWIDKQQIAFDILESRLCEEPLLQRPDFLQPFILTTDYLYGRKFTLLTDHKPLVLVSKL